MEGAERTPIIAEPACRLQWREPQRPMLVVIRSAGELAQRVGEAILEARVLLGLVDGLSSGQYFLGISQRVGDPRVAQLRFEFVERMIEAAAKLLSRSGVPTPSTA